eukprot:1131184-Rhodomonas_salina.3
MLGRKDQGLQKTWSRREEGGRKVETTSHCSSWDAAERISSALPLATADRRAFFRSATSEESVLWPVSLPDPACARNDRAEVNSTRDAGLLVLGVGLDEGRKDLGVSELGRENAVLALGVENEKAVGAAKASEQTKKSKQSRIQGSSRAGGAEDIPLRREEERKRCLDQEMGGCKVRSNGGVTAVFIMVRNQIPAALFHRKCIEIPIQCI